MIFLYIKFIYNMTTPYLFAMNLNILSFNVCGLNDLNSVRLLKKYLDDISRLDIILLQEHKLRGQDASNLGRYLWNMTKSWIVEAAQGYNNDILDLGASCGRTTIFLAPK